MAGLRDALSVGVAKLPASTFDPIKAIAEASAKQAKMKQMLFEQQQKEQAKTLKLLDVAIDAKWNTDLNNTIKPKIQEVRDFVVSSYVKNGKLSDADELQATKMWNDIKLMAELSNEQKTSYKQRLFEFEKNAADYTEQTKENFDIVHDTPDWLSKNTTSTRYKEVLDDWTAAGKNQFTFRDDYDNKYGLEHVPAVIKEYDWTKELIELSNQGVKSESNTQENAKTGITKSASVTYVPDATILANSKTKYNSSPEFKKATDDMFAKELIDKTTKAKTIDEYLIEKVRGYTNSSSGQSETYQKPSGDGEGVTKMTYTKSDKNIVNFSNATKDKIYPVYVDEEYIFKKQPKLTASAKFMINPDTGVVEEYTGEGTAYVSSVKITTLPNGKQVAMASVGGGVGSGTKYIPYDGSVRVQLEDEFPELKEIKTGNMGEILLNYVNDPTQSSKPKTSSTPSKKTGSLLPKK
jgi:hypothetical protein